MKREPGALDTYLREPQSQELPLANLEDRPKTRRGGLRIRERRVLLVLGDFVAATIGLVAALYVWASGPEWLDFSLEFLQVRPPAWFYLLPVFWVLLLVETYDFRRSDNQASTIRGVLTAAAIGLLLYLGIFFFAPNPKVLPRRGVAAFLIAAPLLTLAWRLFYLRVIIQPRFMRRVLVVGGGRAGITLLKVIKNLTPPPIQVIGIVDDDPQKIGNHIETYPVLGGSDCLLDIITRDSVSDIFVAIQGTMQDGMFQTLLEAQEQGIDITRMPVAYEEMLGRVPIHHLEADWILRSFVDQARAKPIYEIGKRLVDIIGGFFGVLLMLITFPFTALAILIDNGLPIFYLQTRCGRGGRPYNMIKYRTMLRDAEPDGQPQWAMENDERATRVGRILRRTHLDELPQFINVLRGEMSLVGPRAERPELVELFQQHVPFYRMRLLVKPGITGWAQINYGYAVTVEDTSIKLEYDLYYIKHRNLLLDLVIVLRTIGAVIGFRGR